MDIVFKTKKFKLVLQEIRELTRKSPDIFKSEIVSLCAKVGVAVVVIPQLPKTGISGATKWLTLDKALIQLSLHYQTDDQFWFSFFYEVGHILLHSKREIFLELDKKQTGENEKEADNFAADFLIPTKDLDAFLKKKNQQNISKQDIECSK